MSRLVSDLLLLARADAGRTGVRHDVDLAKVASAALAEVRPVADGHRLTISEEGPVPVQANEDELHRLAVNLLDNGLRHTPDGSEIKVAVERRNGDAVLEVSDDGPGIPADALPQIEYGAACLVVLEQRGVGAYRETEHRRGKRCPPQTSAAHHGDQR